MTDQKVAVYALVDPRDGKIRYVGQAADPVARFKQHLADNDHAQAKNAEKRRWVKSLGMLGMIPRLEILAWSDRSSVDELERKIITELREQSKCDLNIADGGSGCPVTLAKKTHRDDWNQLAWKLRNLQSLAFEVSADVDRMIGRKKPAGRSAYKIAVDARSLASRVQGSLESHYPTWVAQWVPILNGQSDAGGKVEDI